MTVIRADHSHRSCMFSVKLAKSLNVNFSNFIVLYCRLANLPYFVGKFLPFPTSQFIFPNDLGHSGKSIFSLKLADRVILLVNKSMNEV